MWSLSYIVPASHSITDSMFHKTCTWFRCTLFCFVYVTRMMLIQVLPAAMHLSNVFVIPIAVKQPCNKWKNQPEHKQTTQCPVSLQAFPSQFKFDKNFFSPHPDFNMEISTIFRTYHDSTAVVVFADMRCDGGQHKEITASRRFRRICITNKKTWVKEAPESLQCLISIIVTHEQNGFVNCRLPVTGLFLKCI